MSADSTHRWPAKLNAQVAGALVSAGLLHARPDDVDVQRILNWGGFVNASFRVSDGNRVLHVKLANDAYSAARLERWFSVKDVLHERYAAPRVVHWLELPGPFRGLVSEWVEGETPTAVNGTVRDQAIDALSRLHGDAAFAAHLATLQADAPRSCADHYHATYHDRFVEDLKEIGRQKPPFISDERMEWMERTATDLNAHIFELDAFAERAESPVHADPWINNLIVEPGGRLWIVDWDDLELGDPMIDWGMLFGPTTDSLTVVDEAELAELALTTAERTRLELYAQASLLDWVIDPLADWVEADSQPEVAARVRAEKERVHHEAFALYTARYA